MDSSAIVPVFRLITGVTSLLVLSGCASASVRPAMTPTSGANSIASSTPTTASGCTVVEAAPTPAGFALGYSVLDSIIGLIALSAPQFCSSPPFEIDLAPRYIPTLHTEKGNVVIELDPTAAPLAVNSCVILARQGWYNGTGIHGVIPGFFAQGDDPNGTGRGGPGYYFLNELIEGTLFDCPGVIEIANQGPDTNSNQFFIKYAQQTPWDGSYTVLGHFFDGMGVVESLAPRDPETKANPPRADKILSVTVEVR